MTDAPRLVARYRGMNILDARDRIQVEITGKIPVEVHGWFRVQGFSRCGNRIWDAPHNTQSIAAAQAIGTTFFSEETP
jgi:hypothetical protein